MLFFALNQLSQKTCPNCHVVSSDLINCVRMFNTPPQVELTLEYSGYLFFLLFYFCHKQGLNSQLQLLLLPCCFCTEPTEPKDMPLGHIVSSDLINCVRMFNTPPQVELTQNIQAICLFRYLSAYGI